MAYTLPICNLLIKVVWVVRTFVTLFNHAFQGHGLCNYVFVTQIWNVLESECGQIRSLCPPGCPRGSEAPVHVNTCTPVTWNPIHTTLAKVLISECNLFDDLLPHFMFNVWIVSINISGAFCLDKWFMSVWLRWNYLVHVLRTMWSLKTFSSILSLILLLWSRITSFPQTKDVEFGNLSKPNYFHYYYCYYCYHYYTFIILCNGVLSLWARKEKIHAWNKERILFYYFPNT